MTQASGTYTVSSPDGVPLAAGWAGPVLLSPAGTSPVELVGTALFGGADRTYRGAIRVAAETGGLAAVNVLPLEDYLRGVVPSEMPSSWKPAALQAQAVAARSYALATAAPAGGLFDEFADTRSQAYGGILAERPETDAAIAATAGQILTYGGKVATTYFSSSSGGRTANVQEVFPNAQPTPYLVAVDDPYDAASPYHNWTLTLTGASIAHALGYGGTHLGAVGRRLPLGAGPLAGDRRQRRPEERPGRHRAHRARPSLDMVHDRSRRHDRPGRESVALTLARPRLSGQRVILSGTAPPGAVVLQGAARRGLADARDDHARVPTAACGSRARSASRRSTGSPRASTATPAVRVSVASGLVLRPWRDGLPRPALPARSRSARSCSSAREAKAGRGSPAPRRTRRAASRSCAPRLRERHLPRALRR